MLGAQDFTPKLLDPKIFLQIFLYITDSNRSGGEGVPTSSKKISLPVPAKLRECRSRFSAQPLVELSPNGIAPAPTAARYEPEPFAAKHEARLNLRSALTRNTGFSSEPLPICVRKSNRVPTFILIPATTARDIRQFPAQSC